jgi:hypothetical protein
MVIVMTFIQKNIIVSVMKMVLEVNVLKINV